MADEKLHAEAARMLAEIEEGRAAFARQEHPEPLAQAVAVYVTGALAAYLHEIRELRSDVKTLTDLLAEAEQ